MVKCNQKLPKKIFRKLSTFYKNKFFQVTAVSAYILCLFVLFTILKFSSPTSKHVSETNIRPITEESLQKLPTTTEIMEDITDIKNKIDQANYQQKILNTELFGPLKKNDVIITIQVQENKFNYLQYLIHSLSKVEDIHNVLLVFSHAYYRNEINELIQNITFCKVIQIFYPYSIQTHPHEFPGPEYLDCPHDISIKKALRLKCTNAIHPDMYGHYRNAQSAQLKHHWWWQVNRLFDTLRVTKDHSGMFVFLQEDNYVAEDFLHMLKLMILTKEETCPHCNTYALALGKHLDESEDASLVTISQLVSKMGLALSRPIWHSIQSKTLEFCTSDDFNWDWSVSYISEFYLIPRLYSIIPSVPRVLSIGECFSDVGFDSCNTENNIRRIQNYLKLKRQYLFPTTLKVETRDYRISILKSNGGWSDPRDHNFCINMTTSVPVHKMEEGRVN